MSAIRLVQRRAEGEGLQQKAQVSKDQPFGSPFNERYQACRIVFRFLNKVAGMFGGGLAVSWFVVATGVPTW